MPVNYTIYVEHEKYVLDAIKFWMWVHFNTCGEHKTMFWMKLVFTTYGERKKSFAVSTFHCLWWEQKNFGCKYISLLMVSTKKFWMQVHLTAYGEHEKILGIFLHFTTYSEMIIFFWFQKISLLMVSLKKCFGCE
jgi:hypothetical protein